MPSSTNTATFAFAIWSAFAPKIISIQPPSLSSEAIDDTDLSTTTLKEVVPGDLQEIGEMSIVVRLPSDSEKRFAGEAADLMVSGIGFDPAVGSATISWPAGTTGDGVDPTLVGTAFVTGWAPSEMNNDDAGTATITLQYDGKTGPTLAVGAVS